MSNIFYVYFRFFHSAARPVAYQWFSRYLFGPWQKKPILTPQISPGNLTPGNRAQSLQPQAKEAGQCNQRP